MWSKETGALCPTCGGQNAGNLPQGISPQTPAAAPPVKLDTVKDSSRDGYWRIDWADLKKFALDVWTSKKIPEGFRAQNVSMLKRYLLTESSWAGHTMGQAERWMHEGYITDALQGIEDFNPPIREKRRLQFLEEGDEFHLDLAHAGDENYMSSWTKRQVIAGIKVELQPWFSAFVPAEVVNKFNAWTNKMIYALDSAGVDAEISYVFKGNTGFGNHYTEIRLKKENELTDFVAISPMLSPAAFRTLGHTALTLHAEAFGKDAASYGSSGGGGQPWGVAVAEDKRSIIVTTPSNASSFPEAEMTEKLRLALKEIMKG